MASEKATNAVAVKSHDWSNVSVLKVGFYIQSSANHLEIADKTKKIKTKGLEMQFFSSDHNIDKQTGWVLRMHKPAHNQAQDFCSCLHVHDHAWRSPVFLWLELFSWDF